MCISIGPQLNIKPLAGCQVAGFEEENFRRLGITGVKLIR